MKQNQSKNRPRFPCECVIAHVQAPSNWSGLENATYDGWLHIRLVEGCASACLIFLWIRHCFSNCSNESVTRAEPRRATVDTEGRREREIQAVDEKYTVNRKNVPLNFCLYFRQILTDCENSSTDTLSDDLRCYWFHHTQNASLHYLVKYTFSTIAPTEAHQRQTICAHKLKKMWSRLMSWCQVSNFSKPSHKSIVQYTK